MLHSLLPALGDFFTVTLLASLFALGGWWICLRGKPPTTSAYPLALQAGSGYFIGQGVGIVVYKLLNFLVPHRGAEWALFMFAGAVILVTLAIPALWRNLTETIKHDTRAIIIRSTTYIVLLFGVIFVTVLSLWLAPPLNPFLHVGSGHAGLYTDIAVAFLLDNWVPVLERHFAQSILAALAIFLGGTKPYFIMFTWLVFNMFAMVLTVYGLLRWMGLGGRWLFLGTCFMFFGQTALSLVHVLTIESGWPLILNGYSDTLSSLGLAVPVFVWQVETVFKKTPAGNRGWVYPLFFVMIIIYWFFSAEHMILVTLPSILLCSWLYVAMGTLPARKALLTTGLVVCGVLVGVTQGGLLTPRALLDDTKYFPTSGENAQFEYHVGDKLAGIYPATPYMLATHSPNTWQTFHHDNYVDRKDDILADKIWLVEGRLWEFLRINFFPLLGVVMMFRYFHAKSDERYRLLFLLTGSMLAAGFCGSFLFMINEQKWLVARFMIPGTFFGMLALVVSLNLSSQTRLRTALWLGLLLLASIGPLHNASSAIFYDKMELLKILLKDIKHGSPIQSESALETQTTGEAPPHRMP